MIINAEDLILGRMATYAAKKALNGEKIDIVNCEKAIITGKRKDVLEKYKRKANRGGPFHGPFYPKMPDRFVRRVIRGMLNYKQERGKEASAQRLKTLNFITVSEICNHLKNKKW